MDSIAGSLTLIQKNFILILVGRKNFFYFFCVKPCILSDLLKQFFIRQLFVICKIRLEKRLDNLLNKLRIILALSQLCQPMRIHRVCE